MATKLTAWQVAALEQAVKECTSIHPTGAACLLDLLQRAHTVTINLKPARAPRIEDVDLEGALALARMLGAAH